MVDRKRSENARRALAALATADAEASDVQEAAMLAVTGVVPCDATCWATVDPRSMLPTGSITVDLNPSAQQEALFAEIEYGPTEVNTFTALARREDPVSRLSDLPYGQVVASRRVNELYRPLGVAHDLRVSFLSGGQCWGIAGLMRGTGTSDFSADEAEFLASVAPLVGAALRTAARSRLPAGLGGEVGSGVAGPVVVVFGSGGYRAATPAARVWLEASEAARPGWLGIALHGLAAALPHSPSGAVHARMRDASGSWVMLRAAPLMDLDTAADRVLITVEPAPQAEVTGLMLSAYGLTPREREVCEQVVAGGTTADIAARLHLSAYTVQDHLKAIFGKVGVRSRQQLTDRLRAA